MLRSRSVGVATALGVAVIAAAPEVRAFVQSTTNPTPGQPKAPLSWASSCEVVTVYLNGFTQMSADAVAKSITQAAHTWGPDAVSCPATQSGATPSPPYFDIIPQMSSGGSAPGVVVMDGHNSIIFQTDPAQWTHAPGALAVTSVYPEPSGQIVEADIEINATDPTAIPWTNLDPGSAPARNGVERYDLQTVLTHEFGHFLGLSHTCITPPGLGGSDDGSPTATVDGQGVPIPMCSEVPDNTNATAALSVMWFEIQPESIAQRSLAADDVAAVCAIYPAANQAGTCSNNLPDDGCGCAVGRGQDEGAVPSALIAALLMLGRRARLRRPG
jgi:hypothetical protein